MNKKDKKEGNISFILKRAGRHRFKIVFSGLFSVLSAICKLFPYLLMYQILVQLTSDNSSKEIILKYVVYTIIAEILAEILQFFCFEISHIAAFSILFEIRKNTVNKFGKINLVFLEETQQVK